MSGVALGTWRRGALTAGAAGSLTCMREGAEGAGEGHHEQQQLDLHGWREVDNVSPSSSTALDGGGGGGGGGGRLWGCGAGKEHETSGLSHTPGTHSPAR